MYALKTVKTLIDDYPEFELAEVDEFYRLYRCLYPKEIGEAVFWTDVFKLRSTKTKSANKVDKVAKNCIKKPLKKLIA